MSNQNFKLKTTYIHTIMFKDILTFLGLYNRDALQFAYKIAFQSDKVCLASVIMVRDNVLFV